MMAVEISSRKYLRRENRDAIFFLFEFSIRSDRGGLLSFPGHPGTSKRTNEILLINAEERLVGI